MRGDAWARINFWIMERMLIGLSYRIWIGDLILSSLLEFKLKDLESRRKSNMGKKYQKETILEVNG